MKTLQDYFDFLEKEDNDGLEIRYYNALRILACKHNKTVSLLKDNSPFISEATWDNYKVEINRMLIELDESPAKLAKLIEGITPDGFK